MIILAPHPLADPADLPDLDRAVVAGLSWRAPLDARPIILGETGPTLRPALAIDGGKFWRGAFHGATVGTSLNRLTASALSVAFQPTPTTRSMPVVAVAHAGADYLAAIDAYAAEVTR